MTITLNTTTGSTQVLERGDFAVTAMICNAGGSLEPTIQKLVSLTGNGSTANPLGVRLSSTAGNDLTIDGTGLFYNQTPIVATDSTSIDFTTSGVDGHNITAVVKLSATAGNDLTIDGTGLYYNQTPIVANDSTSIDFTTSGVDGHTITAAAIISGALSGRNNSLSIQPTGLYTPEVRFTATNTCPAGGVGSTWMIREVTDIGNNDFTINGAPEHTCIFSTLSYLPAGLPAALAAVGNVDLANSGTMTLNNPSTCRSVIAQTSIDAFSNYATTAGRRISFISQVLVSINGGIYTILSSNAGALASAAGQTDNPGNFYHRIIDLATVAPSGSRTFSIRHRTNVTAIAGGGTSTWLEAQGFISGMMWTV